MVKLNNYYSIYILPDRLLSAEIRSSGGPNLAQVNGRPKR